MRSRLKGHWRRMAQVLGLILLSVVIVLATAPLWAPRVGLGLPLPPPPGTVVPIPGGHRLNVIDEGSGPSVVLVHGLPGSAHDWRPLPEQLIAAGFRVIRYDRVGYGHSSRRRAGESHAIDSNATDVLQLIAALQLDAPVLVGWSYGGAVAQRASAEGFPAGRSATAPGHGRTGQQVVRLVRDAIRSNRAASSVGNRVRISGSARRLAPGATGVQGLCSALVARSCDECGLAGWSVPHVDERSQRLQSGYASP